MNEGRQEGQRQRLRTLRGVDGAGVGAPAAPVPAATRSGAGGPCVLAEMLAGKKIGDRVNPGPELVRMESYGEAEVAPFCEDRIALARSAEAADGPDRSACDDCRTLEIRNGINGERQRSFRESVKELQLTESWKQSLALRNRPQPRITFGSTLLASPWGSVGLRRPAACKSLWFCIVLWWA